MKGFVWKVMATNCDQCAVGEMVTVIRLEIISAYSIMETYFYAH